MKWNDMKKSDNDNDNSNNADDDDDDDNEDETNERDERRTIIRLKQILVLNELQQISNRIDELPLDINI